MNGLNTYHIHITGLVQGVGFRPMVHKLANSLNISGTVSNGRNGVHIFCNGTLRHINEFVLAIRKNSPSASKISELTSHKVSYRQFEGFSIVQSYEFEKPDLFLTPDVAMCERCKYELQDHGNRRHGYAFTTCLHCGPRYSITKSLPYDRKNTTMAALKMCTGCNREYHDINDSRYWSQTNSCPDCAVKMDLYEGAIKVNLVQGEIISRVAEELLKGKIVAVKGIGGYLLLCDATCAETIRELRARKGRKSKPFAVMYPDLAMVSGDVQLRPIEAEELSGPVSPIVLLQLKDDPLSGVEVADIAPGLGKLGVMLPYAPLLELIISSCQKPLIATSANLSGSPLFYRDDDAITGLMGIADYILTHDREILMPQDDSIVQFTGKQKRIILRRSRGMAPNFFGFAQHGMDNVLALGADMKSSFAFVNVGKTYVSQYLGNQECPESRDCYAATMEHLLNITGSCATTVLKDSHPGYFVSHHLLALQGNNSDIKTYDVQHHKAHFAALLAEHRHIGKNEKILGVIWDGVGYGHDGNIWGSEVFLFENRKIIHKNQLKPFTILARDKMSQNTFYPTLSLLHSAKLDTGLVRQYFDDRSWNFFIKMLEKPGIKTTSMGRFFDAVACLLGIVLTNDFEGEAALKLENLASSCKKRMDAVYPFAIKSDCINYESFLRALQSDIINHVDKPLIAWKFHRSLARLVADLADYYHVSTIGLSGGVFQNALLVDMIFEIMSGKEVLIHIDLPPNDENIALGQLATYTIEHSQVNYSASKLQVSCV